MASQEIFANGRALVIGVSDYANIRGLPSIVLNDVDDVVAALVNPNICGYDPTNVRVLKDTKATKQAIVSELHHIAASAHSDDTVLIYFSGHGGRLVGAGAGVYLCPTDFDKNDLLNTGLEASEVSALLRAIPSRRLAVLFDACHSAGAGVLKSEVAFEEFKSGFGTNDLGRLASGLGKVILASSTEDEPSMILGGMRNSLFTHHLLQGLRGKAHVRGDGLIRVLDLFSYIAEEVPKQANQHPVLQAEAQDNFPVALYLGGKKALDTASLSSMHITDEPRALESVLSELYPSGPSDMEIWSRAGGELSLLKQGQPGRAAWHAAVKILSQGGGGKDISRRSLIRMALEDFPQNLDLAIYDV